MTKITDSCGDVYKDLNVEPPKTPYGYKNVIQSESLLERLEIDAKLRMPLALSLSNINSPLTDNSEGITISLLREAAQAILQLEADKRELVGLVSNFRKNWRVAGGILVEIETLLSKHKEQKS